MGMSKPRFAHQQESVEFFATTNRALDLSDPGTGKTRSQIDAFAAHRFGGGGKALVLAPKSLLNSAWRNDIAQFQPGLRTSVATAKNRAEAFAYPHADVYITNHDAVNWLAKQKPAFFKDFDTLIIDEITAFKHHTSQRSKNLQKIKKYFDRRYGMTGTPNANSVTDLWHQVNVLDDGQRLGRSFYAFRNSVCQPQQIGPSANMVKWVDRPDALAAVTTILSGFTIRHVFEECVTIPENHSYEVAYEMTPSQASTYKAMAEDAVVDLVTHKIIGINAASVITKLLQIASGAVYAEDGTYRVIDTDRYELIADVVEQRNHSVLFFNWSHQRDLLIAEFKKRKIPYVVIDGGVSDKARAQAVTDFQNGLYQVLLAHPASAAHGLTLTKGTATLWASPTYNLEHFLQGNRRIYRAGQTQRTETIKFVAADTIEHKVYEKLESKQLRQDDLLAMVRELNQ